MADKGTWVTRIAEWRASGKTAAQFCEGREYRASTLRFYSSHLNRPNSASRGLRSSARVRLAKVQVDRTLKHDVPELVIELGSAKVIVSKGADTATLVMVLEAIGEIAGVGGEP